MIGDRVKDFWKNKCGPVGKVVTSSALGIILLGVLSNAIFKFVPWLSIPKFIANFFLLIWSSGIRDVLLFLVLLLILILRTRRKKSTRGAGVSFYNYQDEKKNLIVFSLLAQEDKFVYRSALIAAFNKKFGYTTAIEYNLVEKRLKDDGMISTASTMNGLIVELTEEGQEILLAQLETDRAKSARSRQKEAKSAPPPAPPAPPVKQS